MKKAAAWSLVLWHLCGPRASAPFAADWPAFRGNAQRTGSADGKEIPRRLGVLWRFEGEGYRSPSIVSSPAVAGGKVFFGVAEQSVFKSSGRAVCLDAGSGKKLWERKVDHPVFSSPAVSGGRVFIGEGFHQDADCRLRALDQSSGDEAWSFVTQSHVESSPHVEGDRVYFGAGDDGIYCLSAKDGKEIWHVPAMHVDLAPLVTAGRVYAGTGYGELACVCVEAGSGVVLWRTFVDLQVWGSPVRLGNRVYFGMGNGNFLESSERPRGAVICLSAVSGKRVWQEELPDSVLTAVAAVEAGGGTLFVGSRDGNLYALSAATGKVLWKRSGGGGAVVASPLVAGGGKQVLGVTMEGLAAAFSAASGEELFKLNLTALLGKGGGARSKEDGDEKAQVLASPAACNGKVIFGTTSGVLMMLGESP